MVVDDLDGVGVPAVPAETDPELVVHADAVLAAAVTLEGFEAVAGRDAEFVDGLDGVKLSEFAERGLVDRRRQLRRTETVPEPGRSGVGERKDHRGKLCTPAVHSVKAGGWGPPPVPLRVPFLFS